MTILFSTGLSGYPSPDKRAITQYWNKTSYTATTSADSSKIELICSSDYSSQGTTKVIMDPNRIERIATDSQIIRTIPRTTATYNQGPITKLTDRLKIIEIIRIKGKWHSTTHGTVRVYMENCMSIFNGGGTFCLNWAGTYYEVGLKQAIFIEDRVEHVIDYTIDLINGKGPKTP